MTVIRVAAPGTSVAPAPVDSADLRAASDAELLESVRYGDDVAFAVLWHRHLPAAYAAATRFRGRVAAEDLVAEASARVLRLVRQGQGPTHNFRGYFVQTVRSVGVDAVRGSITVVPTPSEDLDLLPGLLPGPEASTVGDVEVDTELVREAFHGLPDSDQELLWRTMVEGEAPRTVAPLLGVSANVVSARAKRARDALRTSYLDAWVQRRAPHCGSPECRWVLDHLSGYVRGRLTPRQQARAGTHLASCPTDARLEADLRRVHDGFRGFVGPLVLIAGAASPALGHGTMAQLVGAHAASAGLGVSSAAGTVTATGATASTATATTTAATATATATTSTAASAVTTAATATTTAATASTVTTTAAAASATTVATASTVTTAATAAATSVTTAAAATSVTTAAAATSVTTAAASTVTTAAVATSTVTTAAAASTAAVGAAAAAVPVAAAALPAAAAVGGTVLLSGTALGPPIASAVAGLVMSLGVSAAPAGASQQQVAQPVTQTVDAPVSLASAPGEGATTGSAGSLAQSLVLPQPGAGATAQVVATTGGALTTVRLGFTTSTGSDPSSIDTSASTTGTTGPAASSTPPSTSGSTGTDPALSAPVPTESSTTAPADTSTTTATTTGTTSPTTPAPDPTSPATAPTTSDPSATGSPTPDPTETAPATSDPSSTVSPTPDPSETATPDPSVSATSEPAATVPVSPQTGG